MASYLASNMRRNTVTLILSKAEAEALRDLALFAEPFINDGLARHYVSSAPRARS